MQTMKNKLSEIHASLTETDNLDADLKAQLLLLQSDINELLEKDKADNFAYAGLEDAARGLGARFTNKHPNLALLLGQLSEMLAKMGI